MNFILHGGPGPIFFSPVIVDYLFGGMSAVNPNIWESDYVVVVVFY